MKKEVLPFNHTKQALCPTKIARSCVHVYLCSTLRSLAPKTFLDEVILL